MKQLLPAAPDAARTAPAIPEFRGTCTLINGLAMFARVSPDQPSTTPIVLVHGLGVSGRYLVPTAVRLALDHPAYVPDLPGFGKSAKPPHVYDIPEQADALAAWMKAWGLRGACLLGNSLGCQYIVDLAVRYPELVSSAVLVGPTTDPRARSVLAQSLRGGLDLFREPLSYWSLLAWDYLVAGPVRTIKTLHFAVRDPLLEKLPRVNVPVLVVRSARDPIAPQRWVDEMARRLPDGRTLTIPGAAHVANYSAPEALAAAVRAFLRET
jgi:2-hydroxy-6-oxonona-2,4-dienedioate hydrolase